MGKHGFKRGKKKRRMKTSEQGKENKNKKPVKKVIRGPRKKGKENDLV